MNNLDDFKYIKGFGGGGGSQAAQPTSAYEDAEGFVYQGANYNVYQFAKVKDLLSEGPIDGLVNGQYVFNGNIGDLGYNQVIYNEYPITIGDASAVSYLKSIQWNQTPLLDSQDKYNFQQINVSATNGTPIGTSVNGSFDNTSYIRSIGERLRGPNNLAVTQDEVADYQRSYRVSNKECKKLSLTFRVSSLYLTLKYQDLAPIADKSLLIDGVDGADVGGSSFQLSSTDRTLTEEQIKNKETTIKGGVGSVLYYKFKIRIKVTPVYKEGRDPNPSILDIVSSTAKVVPDAKDLSITLDSVPSLIEIESKGKVTQGYSKQIILDMSTVFNALNTNENWIGWDISILKITPEDTYSSRSSFINLESITEIYSSSFRYPNSAVVTSKFNAAYFSRIPERAYDVKLLKVKVPSNYDPLTKTYGESIPRTITATNTFSKTDKSVTVDYFIGENNVYANTSDITPPITDGLYAQFDASNASLTTAALGVVTSWPNSVAGPVKCVLGNGTYALPNGSTTATKPTKGGIYSETSPNGTSGVSFLTTQYVKFIDAETPTSFSDANGNYTVFIVAKWHNSATAAERQRILSSVTNNSNWTLGQWKNFNSTFLIGNFVYGVLPGKDGFRQFNRSNYWYTSNDQNTYIIGASVSSAKDVNLFWQNSVYYIKPPTDPTVAPKGLAINYVEASKCTVFEILIYKKALSKTDSVKVRNWLNNKWNVTRSNLSYVAGVNAYNANVLNVGAATSLTIPLKTICANGQRTKPYNDPSSGGIPAADYYEFDLIPQRYWKNWKEQQNFTLKDQGFCSFYCDFYLKLPPSATLGDGTYSLMHRAGQFNLSIKLDGDDTSLILNIISSNENKNYTITKTLDTSKYSTTKLREKFTRVSLYVLPKIVKPSILFTPNAGRISAINIGDSNWTDTYFSTFRQSINVDDAYLAKELGLTINQWTSMVQAVSFREDSNYKEISNLPNLCQKYIAYTFNQPNNTVIYGNRQLAKDYFPDILNAEIDVLLDLEKQIQCNINIANYSYYQTLCVGYDYRPFKATNQPNQGAQANVLFERERVEKLSQTGLSAYNNIDIDKTFDSTPTPITLSSTQTTVLLALQGAQIFDAFNEGNTKTGPFIPAYFIKNNSQIEFFTTNNFGTKFLGFADSIRVNQIEFDRNSLAKAYSRTLFSEGLPKKTTTYVPTVVQSYAASTDYWDGTFKTSKEWTDNPAWCFYDLLTNKRYGAGNYVAESDVDKWSLYQIAKYCDELVSDGFGGVEPRFSCNLYIQTQEDALKVLADMASIFRGMFYYSNGFIFSINDMPEDNPVYSFTNANVIDGNFNYESTSLKDRNSAVYVRYVDKNNLYKPAVEYVENVEAVRKFGFRESELTAFGCTSRGQAQRLGRWLLASEYNETETVSFEAGPECIYLKPGDVIKVNDYNKKYKTVGGRLNYIDISGDVNATTGTLTLDRKLDFNFSGGQNYKLTILSPKYNLDPSVGGAVTTSNDYNEYRKPLTNSFFIGSGNLITGQNYDSIRITGATSVMASSLNVTGLGYFTGASGLSPKSITWALENSGNLNGSTDSDYDFYRIFRIQESTEGTNYTVLGSQVYNLKYTQIESGLNITPPKPPASPALSPSSVLFTVNKDKIDLGIYYDSSIKTSTIGFKVFTNNVYRSDFNANTDTSPVFVPINLYESYVSTSIDKPRDAGTIRVYGVNVNNESPLSYTVGQDSTDTSKTSFPQGIQIIYKDVNPKDISLNSYNYPFNAPVLQKRSMYFLSAVPEKVTDIRPPNSLTMNIPLDFVNDRFKTDEYPYRMRMIPEKVSTKAAFKDSLLKYQSSVNQFDYVFSDDSIDGSINAYAYLTKTSKAKYRDFSIAIDKSRIVDGKSYSTSNDFANADGFLLFTYDNEDSNLKASLNAILTNRSNAFSITTSNNSNLLNITINQNSSDSFVNQFYLLLVPFPESFKFGINSIIYKDNAPFSVKDSSGNVIIDSHFISITNTKTVFTYNGNTDSNGKSFNSTTYIAYLIAEDSLMSAWVSSSQDGSTRSILDYTSTFIDKDDSVGKIYPQISDPIVIQKAIDPTSVSSLEALLKASETSYLHFTLNQTMMIENIFDTALSAGSVFPNYTISRKSVVYKPTLNVQLTALKDEAVLSKDPNGTSAYYKLSLQNRGNLSQPSISPPIPKSKRAYALNGNKIFTRALVQNTTATPQLLQGLSPEGSTSNVFQIRNKITNSFFGQDNEELFDISIIKLSDFADSTDSLKSQIMAQNADYISNYFLKVNSETSNSEATSKTIFDELIKKRGIFSSPFNIINVTPEDNWKDIGVSSKNVSVFLTNSPQTLSVYSLDGPTISSTFGISTLNDLWYAGVPVLEKIETLSIKIQIPNPTTTKPIKVYCYNGEDFIPSTQINSTQITKEGPNNIVITLSNLIPKNYYTYADSYANNTAITTPLVNQRFWNFIEPRNLAFAHLSAKKALNNMPKYNFHIQALELSIVITY
jgi:hypothetical protein